MLFGKEYEQACNDPVIIHYADPEKPWKFTNLPFGEVWDKLFSESVFRDISLDRKRFSLIGEYVRRLWSKGVRKISKLF